MAPEAGNFAIELVYNWGKDDAYPGGERFGHFAFEVEDIDPILPGIEAAGGRVTRPPYLLEGSGPRLCFIEDPDGNAVELSSSGTSDRRETGRLSRGRQGANRRWAEAGRRVESRAAAQPYRGAALRLHPILPAEKARGIEMRQSTASRMK